MLTFYQSSNINKKTEIFYKCAIYHFGFRISNSCVMLFKALKIQLTLYMYIFIYIKGCSSYLTENRVCYCYKRQLLNAVQRNNQFLL